MPVTIKNKTEKLRFGMVGVANTAIDFGILLTLTTIGVPAAIANYPSATTAVVFSFFANKKYTFNATGKNLRREIILFLCFTLFAAWILQPLTILLVMYVLTPFPMPDTIAVVVAKVAATAVTLVWNYITYSRYVFTKNK